MATGAQLGELAKLIGAELHGDPERMIAGIASLEQATQQQISFLSQRKYARFLADTGAGAVILEASFLNQCPVDALVVPNAYVGYAQTATILAALFKPKLTCGIHPRAVISEDAQVSELATIGANAVVEAGAIVGAESTLMPGSYVGHDVRIGDGTVIGTQVTLYDRVVIGHRCILHSGVVIGADGFGIAENNGRWLKIPQLGTVRIGNDVEIGANTTLDRGALNDTVIEDGVKLDNLVQIGHAVHIGAHTAIAAGAAIGGSTSIGAGCKIGARAAINSHVRITDGVVLTPTTVVERSIDKAGIYSSILLPQPLRKWRRNAICMKDIYGLWCRVRKLEQQR